MKRVTIVDYGAGNLHSLAKALAYPDTEVLIAPPDARALDTDVIVLPGVGNFAQASSALAPVRDGLRERIETGGPTFGICLGMQLLFDASDEGGGRGLGVIAGRVTRVRAARVPHVGWNDIEGQTDRVFAHARLRTAYFANSFACRPVDIRVVTAWTTHEGDRFPAMVRAGAAAGTQFHPEKSGRAGVEMLRRFLGEALS